MKRLSLYLRYLILLPLLSACSSSYNPLDDYEQLDPETILETPAAMASSDFSPEQVAQGQYLVGLLGCGSCHSNGALVGVLVPGQLLAGSDTGIAYSNPLVDRYPGVVYPANLTSDIETGIGSWSAEEIVGMVQAGIDKHSSQTLPVMPWPAYVKIKTEDAFAIAAYLKSLPPVNHKVPDNVARGQRASAPFVHFGVYQSKK